MLRTMGWFLLVVLGLAIVAGLSLSTGGSEGLVSSLGNLAMEKSDAGQGYDDGQLVWRDTGEIRLTVEQLPSLEGRRLGSSSNSGFFTGRMSWFGISLRDAIARCVDLPSSRVLGDESLDGFWFDIDAARKHGFLEHDFDGWDDAHARILEGLTQHYGVSVALSTEQLPVKVMRAGPAWSQHLGGDRDGQVMRSDGSLSIQGQRTSVLLSQLRVLIGVELTENMDLDAPCTVDLHWDPADPDGLTEALAEQLDLHVEEQLRDLQLARVEGVATRPAHLK